ncbi:TniQ family protein [Paenibacillus xylaniclasticus]|uniref:TniQ family protein n=1 Tax=Paenibacillus xylaniclasticus TaxID=588083 RepID=UPI0013E0D7BF|nr:MULTISPECIES: TniQ family protein [Paenibacillus]GFN33848.1 hypothetical protein PCURB6_41080 [Paenibacillus curdlanolyticus]
MFINRPERYHDESLSSYLFRVARANYRPIGVLTTSFKITRAEWLRNTFSDEQITKISSHLNQPKSNLSQGTYHIYQNVLDENMDSYLLKNRMKYCPDCLREKAYHRTMWGLKPITICLRHESRLIDTCAHCNTPIIMDQFMNGLCKRCGYRYYQTESILIPSDSIEYEFQSEFQSALFKDGDMFQNLGGLNAKQFLQLAHHSFYLLEGLTSFLDEPNKQIRIFHNRRGGIELNESLAEAYNHVYWIYRDFPHRFHLILTEFLKKPRRKIYGQKKAFEDLFLIDGFDIIKNEYEQFWIEQLESGVVRKDLSIFKHNQELLHKVNYFRKEEVKQLIGISYPKLESLHESGLVEMRSRNNGKTKQHFVDKSSLVHLLDEKQNYINKKEAARILGIQRDSVSQLVKPGLLNEVEIGLSRYKLILLEEVLRLLERSRGILNTNVEGITFHQALIKYSVNGLTISRLLKFIHQKVLQPQLAVLNGNLSDIWFWGEEMQRCIEVLKIEKQNTDGMYMQDVMQQLKIGEKKMKTLMETDQLIPDRVIVWKDGRRRYLFNRGSVEEYKMRLAKYQ